VKFEEAVKLVQNGDAGKVFVARPDRNYTICSVAGLTLQVAEEITEYVDEFKKPYCQDYVDRDLGMEWSADYCPWIEDILAVDWEVVDWDWEDIMEPFVDLHRDDYVEKYGVAEESGKEL
jgi:hypothetical protein